MDQKRLLLATVLSMIVVGGWYTFVVPRLIPPRQKPVNPVVAQEGASHDKTPPSEGAPLTGGGSCRRLRRAIPRFHRRGPIRRLGTFRENRLANFRSIPPAP